MNFHFFKFDINNLIFVFEKNLVFTIEDIVFKFSIIILVSSRFIHKNSNCSLELYSLTKLILNTLFTLWASLVFKGVNTNILSDINSKL
jgi:hypothetical protein